MQKQTLFCVHNVCRTGNAGYDDDDEDNDDHYYELWNLFMYTVCILTLFTLQLIHLLDSQSQMFRGFPFCFQAISTILDKQSMLFIDTADMLARMSRETLVKAR